MSPPDRHWCQGVRLDTYPSGKDMMQAEDTHGENSIPGTGGHGLSHGRAPGGSGTRRLCLQSDNFQGRRLGRRARRHDGRDPGRGRRGRRVRHDLRGQRRRSARGLHRPRWRLCRDGPGRGACGSHDRFGAGDRGDGFGRARRGPGLRGCADLGRAGRGRKRPAGGDVRRRRGGLCPRRTGDRQLRQAVPAPGRERRGAR